MSDEKPKKKRFEGLIQFKDALRQTVVCLQAAMDSRFMTTIQSDLVKSLDENHPGSHHLLFAMGAAPATRVDSADQLQPRHLLAKISQNQGDDLRSTIDWSPSERAQASIWLDSSDGLMANLIFWLISVACSDNQTFHLHSCLNWGSAIHTESVNQANDFDRSLKAWQHKFHLSQSRIELMQAFLGEAQALLEQVDQLSLLSDGSFIGLMAEGPGLACDPASRNAQLKALGQLEAHSITINLAKDSDGITQILMIIPIREANQSLNQTSLRGFIILENIRPTAAPSKTGDTHSQSA